MGSTIHGSGDWLEIPSPKERRPQPKLAVDAFGTFDGTLAKWHVWEKLVLAKAGAAGLHKYFTADYVIGDSEDHIINIQTVYFMLKLSTDNGDAEGCIEPFAATTDGHDVWQAIKKKYEGDEIPGELAKTLRRQLRNLQLTSKDDALLFMNKFELLSNQLEKIGRKQT